MVIELAERKIEINCLHTQILSLCRDYESEGEADFTVTVTRRDIEYERSKAEPGTWTDGYMETLAVYRKIAETMPKYDTVLFHGSCVAVNGSGYLFTARSGTGKSTHARLWREMLGELAVMVNDDKPLIRVKDGQATVYGTPWDGKHRLSRNMSVPLKALCLLSRAENNTIRRITAAEAYPLLLQQIYRPGDFNALEKTLALLDELMAAVPLFSLGCNMDIGAASLAYEAMR